MAMKINFNYFEVGLWIRMATKIHFIAIGFRRVVEGDRTYFDSPSDGLLFLCTTIFIKMGGNFNKKHFIMCSHKILGVTNPIIT
jgi:hypothetical protein